MSTPRDSAIAKLLATAKAAGATTGARIGSAGRSGGPSPAQVQRNQRESQASRSQIARKLGPAGARAKFGDDYGASAPRPPAGPNPAQVQRNQREAQNRRSSMQRKGGAARAKAKYGDDYGS